MPYWIYSSDEVEKLRLTKAEYRIMGYIGYRAGPPRYVCFANVAKIAYDTKTHPVYVRHVIRHLEHRGLVIKTERPGRTNELRLVDKIQWMAAHPHGDADKVHVRYEETRDESAKRIMWETLWTICPDAPKSRYEKLYKEDPTLFESVLADVKERVERERDPRRSAESIGPIKNVWGLFQYTWDSWKRTNDKRKR